MLEPGGDGGMLEGVMLEGVGGLARWGGARLILTVLGGGVGSVVEVIDAR